MYKSYILPVIEIGNFTLDGSRTNQIKILQRIQNKALRICYRVKATEPSFPLHLRANLLSLDYRKNTCLLGIINLKLLKEDGTFEVGMKDNRTRGKGLILKVDFPTNERFKKSLNYAGPQIWNALPLECRENLWPTAFKRNVKNYFWSMFKERATTS